MFLIVYTTIKNKRDADKISNILIKERLAACVNYFPVKSVYRWKNKIEKNSEYILICKTTKKNFKELKNRLKEIHPYELPEIVVVSIPYGDKKYLDWIKNSVEM